MLDGKVCKYHILSTYLTDFVQSIVLVVQGYALGLLVSQDIDQRIVLVVQYFDDLFVLGKG